MGKQSLPSPDPAVLALLDGSDLAAKIGLTIQLITVAPDGRPRVALLSVGEVVAVSPSQWRIALYAHSQSARNLASPGSKGVICVVAGGAHHVHEIVVRSVRAEPIRGLALSVLAVSVESTVRDRVDYATVTSGITYELMGPRSEVLERWTETIRALTEGDGDVHNLDKEHE